MVQDRYPVSHCSCGDISRPFSALTDVSTCRLAPWCPGPQGTALMPPCCPCSVPWDLCRQLGELRAVRPSSQGAFLSWSPSFPGRLHLGLVLPAHKVAEDTPAPSVADISYFPLFLSFCPSRRPTPLSSGWVGKEGKKVGTFPFLQLNLGKRHPHLRGPGRSRCSSCCSYQWASG